MEIAASLILCVSQAPAAPAREPATAADFAAVERDDRTFEAAAARARRAYVSITVERGNEEIVCSGTLVDGEGRVAVPAGGVAQANRIYGRWEDRTFIGDVWFEDPSLPIAVVALRTTAVDKPPDAPQLAPEGSLGVGHRVVLVSNANDFEGTVQFGRVSGLERRVRLFPELRLVQTSIGAVPGTPGGPLTNARGEVVGVLLGGAELHAPRMTLVELLAFRMEGANGGNPAARPPGAARPVAAREDAASSAGGGAVRAWTRPEGRAGREGATSFALPIRAIEALVQRVAASRPQASTSDRPREAPYLGVLLREGLDEPLRHALELPPGHGLLVEELVEASPAKGAGIERFDVFVRLDGVPVRTNDQFRRCLADAAARGGCDIELLRGGKPKRVRVDLAGVK